MKYYFLLGIALFFSSCRNKALKKHNIENQDTSSNSSKVFDSLNNKTLNDTTKNKELYYGILEKEDAIRYYPKVLDTIIDQRIIANEKLSLSPGNKFKVSLLHNSGTFDQIFLCIHDSIDQLKNTIYIGKATDFDGKSQTIEYAILDSSTILFTHTFWGYFNNDEIGITKKFQNKIHIDSMGKIVSIIQYKKTNNKQ